MVGVKLYDNLVGNFTCSYMCCCLGFALNSVNQQNMALLIKSIDWLFFLEKIMISLKKNEGSLRIVAWLDVIDCRIALKSINW